MKRREAERRVARQVEDMLDMLYVLIHYKEMALITRRQGNMFAYSMKILTGREPMEKCEFCYATDVPLAVQDMGEGRTLRLCAACQSYIEQGKASEQASGPASEQATP